MMVRAVREGNQTQLSDVVRPGLGTVGTGAEWEGKGLSPSLSYTQNQEKERTTASRILFYYSSLEGIKGRNTLGALPSRKPCRVKEQLLSQQGECVPGPSRAAGCLG